MWGEVGGRGVSLLSFCSFFATKINMLSVSLKAFYMLSLNRSACDFYVASGAIVAVS